MGDLKTNVIGRFVGGSLFGPKDDNGRLKYSACIVLEPGEEKKIEAIRDAAKQTQWGPKQPSKVTDWTLREGDDPEFETSFGNNYINPKASEKSQPKTVIKRAGVLAVC